MRFYLLNLIFDKYEILHNRFYAFTKSIFKNRVGFYMVNFPLFFYLHINISMLVITVDIITYKCQILCIKEGRQFFI